MQHRGRQRRGRGSSLGPRPRLLLRRNPRAPGLQLARRDHIRAHPHHRPLPPPGRAAGALARGGAASGRARPHRRSRLPRRRQAPILLCSPDLLGALRRHRRWRWLQDLIKHSAQAAKKMRPSTVFGPLTTSSPSLVSQGVTREVRATGQNVRLAHPSGCDGDHILGLRVIDTNPPRSGMLDGGQA